MEQNHQQKNSELIFKTPKIDPINTEDNSENNKADETQIEQEDYDEYFKDSIESSHSKEKLKLKNLLQREPENLTEFKCISNDTAALTSVAMSPATHKFEYNNFIT